MIKLNEYKKVLAMDARTLSSLSDEEFVQAVRAVTTEAKRRKTRLAKTKTVEGTKSPAYRKFERNLWNIPKDRSKGMIQIAQAKQFINDKTSSVSGYQEYQKQIQKSFNEKLGVKLNKPQFQKVSNILSDLESNDWFRFVKQDGNYDSEREVKSIVEMTQNFKNKSTDEIVDMIADNYKYQYEKLQWEQSDKTINKPLVPESLKDIYPKEFAEQQTKQVTFEELEDISKDVFK